MLFEVGTARWLRSSRSRELQRIARNCLHGLEHTSVWLGEGAAGNVRKATGRGDAYRLWVRGILRGV
jgi:hypothetical protein